MHGTGVYLLLNGDRNGDTGGLQVGIEQRGQAVGFGLGGEVIPIGQFSRLLSQLMVLGWMALRSRTESQKRVGIF